MIVCFNKLFFSFLFLALPFAYCSNFTSTKQNTVPPLLVSITKTTSGYTMTVRANNPEFFFLGYRLFIGKSESEARNPASLANGTDCASGLSSLPVFSQEYTFYITPDPNSKQNALCTFIANIQPGDYISVRSLLLAIQPNQNVDRVAPSGPSNTLIVP